MNSKFFGGILLIVALLVAVCGCRNSQPHEKQDDMTYDNHISKPEISSDSSTTAGTKHDAQTETSDNITESEDATNKSDSPNGLETTESEETSSVEVCDYLEMRSIDFPALNVLFPGLLNMEGNEHFVKYELAIAHPSNKLVAANIVFRDASITVEPKRNSVVERHFDTDLYEELTIFNHQFYYCEMDKTLVLGDDEVFYCIVTLRNGISIEQAAERILSIFP